MRLFFLSVTVFFILLMGCKDNRNNIIQDDTTEERMSSPDQDFISVYFNDYNQCSAEKEDSDIDSGLYEVSLRKKASSIDLSNSSTAIKLLMDKDGDWMEIQSLRYEGPLPVSVFALLPHNAELYLKESYPKVGIQGMKKIPGGYRVELVNDKDFLFDEQGELLGYNSPED